MGAAAGSVPGHEESGGAARAGRSVLQGDRRHDGEKRELGAGHLLPGEAHVGPGDGFLNLFKVFRNIMENFTDFYFDCMPAEAGEGGVYG